MSQYVQRVAVAGGAGSVGKAFVSALLDSKKFEVVVLSRSERQSTTHNLRYAKVDYDDVSSLFQVLESNKIDTIISALNMITDEASQAQLNLISAAKKSTITKNFLPSEWGIVPDEETADLDPYGKYILASAKVLAKSELNYSRIAIGFVSDYWAMPDVPTTFTEQFVWAVDVQNGTATIPGSGQEKISMTYTPDLAKFVVRLLDEDPRTWPKEAAVVGQDVTFNQILEWAEKARGHEFTVSYKSQEDLNKDLESNDELTALAAMFGLMQIQEHIWVPKEKFPRLNDRFPELNVLTMEEMIRKYVKPAKKN